MHIEQSKNKVYYKNINCCFKPQKKGMIILKCKAKLGIFKITLLESGLSYKQLIEKSSASSSTIAKISKGNWVQSRTAKRIADALGKPVTELFTVE